MLVFVPPFGVSNVDSAITFLEVGTALCDSRADVRAILSLLTMTFSHPSVQINGLKRSPAILADQGVHESSRTRDSRANLRSEEMPDRPAAPRGTENVSVDREFCTHELCVLRIRLSTTLIGHSVSLFINWLFHGLPSASGWRWAFFLVAFTEQESISCGMRSATNDQAQRPGEPRRRANPNLMAKTESQSPGSLQRMVRPQAYPQTPEYHLERLWRLAAQANAESSTPLDGHQPLSSNGDTGHLLEEALRSRRRNLSRLEFDGSRPVSGADAVLRKMFRSTKQHEIGSA